MAADTGIQGLEGIQRVRTPEELRALTGADFTLSDQQWAAVSAPLEPAVVIAGAGSGKTSLMAARVVYLVANGLVRPDQVLGLTFTTKAAAELRNRVRTALADAGFERGVGIGEDEVLEPTVSTYNAYAARLLTEHGLRIGHEPDTRVMADASRYQLAARAIGQHTGRIELLSDSPSHVITWLLQLEAAMSEHLVGAEQVTELDRHYATRVAAALEVGPKGELGRFADALAKREELLGLVADYRRLKAELGLMDFSDQIALAARLVEEHPDVGRSERDAFRIVLLDEYQDTSVAQARMLSALFSGATDAGGRGHAVTAVGDPNQAIYGWRGASVSNILHFGDDFPRADGDVDVAQYPLTVNRRSDARILTTANALARPLLDRYPSVQPLEAPGDAVPGEVHTCVHETYAGELAWLARRVLAAHDAGTDWREVGVLTRDNQHAADVFDALTTAGVPVEIVGLKGLLRLPEVAEVVAVLTLLGDLTANAELLQLLSGPRWAVGPRDLALLGRRSRELVDGGGRPARSAERPSVSDELRQAVAGADPTEVAALCDALEDPGELPYSTEALERFGLLATELRHLRAHVGEPLLELVRRIIDTCGIDVELASSVSETGRARRDNLDLFVKAVAEFQAVDGDVTLPALLSYLTAEDELGGGLDVATPSESDSVKLLTVHRAKGLEWDVVFLPGMCEEKFPHKTLRQQWTTGAHVLPIPLRGDARDLPALPDVSADGMKQQKERARGHQQEEELRLGYVALTRPRHQLWVSSYLWTESRKTPVGPSPYQETVRAAMAGWGDQPEQWLEKPPKGSPNPAVLGAPQVSWPVTEQTAEALRRIDAAERVRAADPAAPDPEDLDLTDLAAVAQWDEDLERLVAEARRADSTVVEVPLPSSMSATAVARLRDDPEAFAADLVRPMPRQPSPAARFGTRFHAWVEARFGQQQLLDPDDLPGRADLGIEDEAELRTLVQRFEQGPFGEREPYAVEAPFALVLAGQVVRGRIDAVYREGDGHLVVDWKTNQRQNADPLQLALYRVAWADLHGVPVEQVRAAFHYVRTGETVVVDDLPDREELERLFGPGGPPPVQR